MTEKFYVTQNGNMDTVSVVRVEDGHSVIVADVISRGDSKLSSWKLAEKLRTLLNTTKDA